VADQDLVAVVLEEEEEEVEILLEVEGLVLSMMFGAVRHNIFQELMLAECGPCNRR
jgi:hypothetical protein